jgi:arginine/ornithine N-succinyltransferase beta subunit
MFMMVLENVETGQVRGTCQIFGMVGTECAFYSYRISTLTQTSQGARQDVPRRAADPLHRSRGLSEVGGLSSIPASAPAAGLLLARSRYLFIRQHRARSATASWPSCAASSTKRRLALLGRDRRQVLRNGFPGGDEFNAMHGTQFIADLMPKTPIYTAMLPRKRAPVMGVPAPSRPRRDEDAGARRLRYDCYVDIFDGGPTMSAPPTRSARPGSRSMVLDGIDDEAAGEHFMLAAGGSQIRACYGHVEIAPTAHSIDRAAPNARHPARRQLPRHGPLTWRSRDQLRRHHRPSHNYAGLSLGNLASTGNALNISHPRDAALQGIEKMRHNLGLGLAQGIFVPLPRPNHDWLSDLGTSVRDVPDTLRPAAFSASAMWAANAATVSPAPDTDDGLCHLTVANLRTMAHRSHEWPDTYAQLRLAFASGEHFQVHRPVPATFGDEGAANTCGSAPRTEKKASKSSSTASAAAPFRPASMSRPAAPSPASTRLDPERTLFAAQAEEAIAAGAFHNDVVAVANENVLFAHEHAFENRPSSTRRCAGWSRGGDRRGAGLCHQPRRCDQELYVQCAARFAARGRHGLILPRKRGRLLPCGAGSSR